MTTAALTSTPFTPHDPLPAPGDWVRPPAVAGRFYPADYTGLEHAVHRLLDSPRRLHFGGVRALVAPHAGYVCSGEVAGAAYHTLVGLSPVPGRIVYLLGPAHWKAVEGVGLSSAAAWQTPLGDVPLAAAQIQRLVATGRRYHHDDAAHAPEHCLEVQLPFLQAVLPGLAIVPLLFDDTANPDQVAADLCPLLAERPDDLLVVSTDLSHYHSYQDAIILDHALLKALAVGDLAGANAGEACGLLPLLCLMHVAQHFGWQPHLLAYLNSGDTCSSRREVVGYGAVAYTA
jgi:AmmeMemoRadiSam system protein B